MNKEFTVIDDKVVVVDEIDSSKHIEYQVDYQDNIKEILKQENRIEKIEDVMEQINVIISKYYNNKTTIFFDYLWRYVFLAFSSIFLYIVFSSASILLALSVPFVCTPLLIMDNMLYIHKEKMAYKSSKRAYEYFNKELQKQEEKLEELQEVKTKAKISEYKNKIIQIEEDKSFLEKLKNRINLFYELGIKMDEYQVLLQKGKLRDELLKTHNEEDTTFIEDIVSEEGRKLEYTKENINLKY